MDKGGSTPNIPNPPNTKQSYQQGTNTYLGMLDRYLNAEQGARNTYDPQRIAENQANQSKFGHTQYAQMLDALRQIDPTGYNLREQTGKTISNNLAGNFSPGQTEMVRRAEAARGNVYGQAAVTGEGMNLSQNALQNSMNFQNSATPESWMSAIPPISADRSMAYVNPNAGFMGINSANQGFQNQLGAAGLGMQPQNNSWMTALGSAAQLAGAFSDPRLKSNVSKVGKANGMNLYKYDIQEPKRTEIGVMADEVAKKRPDAVMRDPTSGYMKVMYGKLGLRNPMPVSA